MPELLLPIFIFYLVYLYLTMKKSKTVTTEKPAPKAKAEQPATTVAKQAAPKKPSPEKKVPIKPKVETTKAVAVTPEIGMPERVGLTAGSVWHYLSGNGATSVAKLLKELPEDEKIIQRSIGWLAQEGKITLDTIDRVETIALK
jgi:hypothetical protein